MGDLLTAYNGEEIDCDGIGNPLSYVGGMEFNWQNGRQLAGIETNEAEIGFSYDASGMRYSKTVNDGDGVSTTRYFYGGGALLAERRGQDTLAYYYDTSGMLYAFDYKQSGGAVRYYYLRSPNGDIVGILDAQGELVVEYSYDAWGNILDISGAQITDREACQYAKKMIIVLLLIIKKDRLKRSFFIMKTFFDMHRNILKKQG